MPTYTVHTRENVVTEIIYTVEADNEEQVRSKREKWEESHVADYCTDGVEILSIELDEA